MAPKALASIVAPSAILADAVNAFMKNASRALAAAEEQAKLEVAQVNTELQELRRERDKNMKFVNQTQLQEKDWEHHGDMLRTSLEKSELTIKHQADTIVQLRNEVAQWKSVEGTARKEIQDWKAQYLRAEHERLKLSTRIDELVAEQLENATQQTNNRASVLRTPKAVDMPISKRQPSTIRQPRPSMVTMPSESEDDMPPPRKAKSRATTAQNVIDRERTFVDATPKMKTFGEISSKKTPALKLPPTSRASSSRTDLHAPHQPPQLIRRVHAVVEVPVKEEVYSDEDNALESGGSDWQPEKKSVSRSRRRSSVKSKPYVEIEEDEGDDDDDEDQLLIGSEDNPSEIYGTSRAVVADDVRPSHDAYVKAPTGGNKKRKLNADSTVGGRSVTKAAKRKQ
ncbi:hypothetical protein BC835DRAFT_1414516 [Cytidiella melzeri]|nr:hypothetical protein BC835DRAFT_1414516 [Cytidiella melzeri]